MITIQKVTSNVQSVIPPFSRHLLTRRTVFSNTVFSIARSTFRMYSAMAIFKLSIVWGLFKYTEFFIAPQRKIGRRKIRRSWRPNGFRNDSVHKHVVQECHRHMRCMSFSAILLKAGFVNFIFFQLHNKGMHNIVTVPLGVDSLREKKKMGPAVRLRDIPTPTRIFSSCSGDSRNAWGLFAHQTREFWLLVYPEKWKYASSVKNVTSKMSSLSRSRKSKNHLQYATRLALSPGFNSCTAVIL